MYNINSESTYVLNTVKTSERGGGPPAAGNQKAEGRVACCALRVALGVEGTLNLNADRREPFDEQLGPVALVNARQRWKEQPGPGQCAQHLGGVIAE